MTFPFEVGFDEVRFNLDACVDAVFECLESEFLVMPKGAGFVEFPAFEACCGARFPLRKTWDNSWRTPGLRSSARGRLTG